MMIAIRWSVLFLGFLSLLLAGGPAGGETLPLNSYRMTFKGYSADTIRGIEEYIVEFPLYVGYRLVREGPRGNEYEYDSAEDSEGIAASLRRMFAYLDVEGRMDIDGMRITVTRTGYIPPAAPPIPPPPLPEMTRLTLRLSTARGDMPAFTIGETFDLTVQLSRDAWLYCFYRQVDGRIVKFFPNPHHEDAWMKGGREHRVPGAIYPFELEFAEPPGMELLTCFATGRDVRADLPAALRVPDWGAVPPGLDSRLHELFDELTDTDVARASLPIAVKR